MFSHRGSFHSDFIMFKENFHINHLELSDFQVLSLISQTLIFIEYLLYSGVIPFKVSYEQVGLSSAFMEFSWGDRK